VGYDIDGVLPDDQRRAGSFAWPPPKTVYAGARFKAFLATAIILDRAGSTEFGTGKTKRSGVPSTGCTVRRSAMGGTNRLPVTTRGSRTW
jgi:hypothetical protein